jgi:hypothetical protein
MYNGRRQPSRDGTSRMTRECHVRFCEGLGVKFPGPTRQPLAAVSYQRSYTMTVILRCPRLRGPRRMAASPCVWPSFEARFARTSG